MDLKDKAGSTKVQGRQKEDMIGIIIYYFVYFIDKSMHYLPFSVFSRNVKRIRIVYLKLHIFPFFGINLSLPLHGRLIRVFTVYQLTSTHNLCPAAALRKIMYMYTPAYLYIKCGLWGC